ncbi:hypothetical protein [Pelagibacterium sp.]|uniref:hypothetical protein n=1 Tax=Pelagibacterium sp. TaxID=1967288 RepID=UPI003A8E1BF7
MKIAILTPAALLAASIALPATATDFDYSSLIGAWTVEGVAVPDDGVQALIEDDPQYMGDVIEFGPDMIEWTAGTDTRPIDPSIDNCPSGPSLAPHAEMPDETPIENGFDIMCDNEEWGTIVPVDDQGIQLHWYDNGVLTLTRE